VTARHVDFDEILVLLTVINDGTRVESLCN